MDDIRITRLDSGHIALVSPYNPEMPPKARALGGKWDATSKTWQFDGRDEERVRHMAREIWGTDGNPDVQADTVTVRVKVREHEISFREGGRAVFAGRTIVERPGRDANVRLARNVVLIAGQFSASGGSARYPQIEAADDVIVEIRDLPRAALSIEDDDSYEIVDTKIDVEALRTERQRLLARLAEIDAALA